MTGKITGLWISQDATFEDLIPGKPDDLDDLARELRNSADSFAEAAATVRKLDTSSWQGEAAEAFRVTVVRLPKNLDAASEAFRDAEEAIRRYRHTLIAAQAIAKDVIEHDAPAARAASRRHQHAIDDYTQAQSAGSTGVEKPPSQDPGEAAMAAAVARIAKARSDVEDAAKAAKGTLRDAAGRAPDSPSQLVSFLKGLGESTVGLVDFAIKVNPAYALVDPEGYVETGTTQLDSLILGAKNPVEFGKSAVDWDTWHNDPARAFGHLIPDLALAVATEGAGGGLRGVPKGGTARKATERPREVATPARSRPCRCDPIDVSSGEMILPQSDVRLPAALPLVLERTHISSYRAGGWFGPSWASTLDQRLELDEQGVVYASPDGMLLVYPAPQPETEMLPVEGPRWPLRWDGTPQGQISITNPDSGHTLHFAELTARPGPPGGALVLPIQAVTDRNGHRIAFRYDSTGAPVEVVHSGGYRIAVDIAGSRVVRLRLKSTDSAPDDHGTPLLTYSYDSVGHLTEITNSSRLPLSFTYDTAGRITDWVDRRGTRYRYTYDNVGRCIRTSGPNGFQSGTFSYHSPHDPTATAPQRSTVYTDSLGHTTTFRLNDLGQVVQETDPLGHTTINHWDRFDRLLSRTDPLGRTTRYSYDTAGNLSAINRPDGSTATAAYNEFRQPLVVNEPGGPRWQYRYDSRGNLTSTTDPLGATTAHAYDEHGHLASTTDALGNTSHTTCNPAGLPLSVTDPAGATTHCTRDRFGRITTVTDPLGAVTRTRWTVEGKPAWRILPDDATQRWEWDGEGNLTEHTDAAGHRTTYEYGHFDLPVTQMGPDGARHTFTYDTELRLRTVTNPHGLTWTYAYDPTGRLISETDFNDRMLTYAYDAAGQLIAHTNGAGQTKRYTHDALGNVTAQHTDHATTTYTYDPVGRLTRATNLQTTLVLERDAAGRMLTETCNGRTLTTTYDRLGQRTSRTTPGGVVSTWKWNPAGTPTELCTAGHTVDFNYDAAGRETIRRIGPNLTFTQDWDQANRPASQTLTATHASGLASVDTHVDLDRPPPFRLRDLAEGVQHRVMQQRSYRYRSDGVPISINERGRDRRDFTLDTNGRVTTVTCGDHTESYAYDLVGNLTQATTTHGDDTNGERAYSGTLSRRAGRTWYTHDAQGRLIRTTRKLLSGGTRTWTYTWSPEDRLTDVTTPDGNHWRYIYDPLGRRTAKQRLSEDGAVAEETLFTWDGAHLVEQSTGQGNTTWDYAPGTHRPLTQLDQNAVDTRFYAIITDLVGTPTELVTEGGHLAWQHHTTLWGMPAPLSARPAQGTASADCPLRFPGQYADDETGLNYNYQRYYNPETAHYTAPDRLGLAPSKNHHSYVANPYMAIDPLGLAPCQPNILGNTPGGWHPTQIPPETLTVIKGIEEDGVMVYSKAHGVQGPQVPEGFANDGRNNGYRLPKFDTQGAPITYREWGTIQSPHNPKPGGERIVTGSDGSIYYSPTHYQTWIQYR